MKYLWPLFLLLLTSCLPGRSSLFFEAPLNDLHAQDVAVNFRVLSEKILVPKCISCHEGFADEKNVLKYVTPENPEESKLFLSVKTGQMPEKGSPLTSEELEVVRLYIENPQTFKIGFDELNTAIIAPRCVQCHKRTVSEETLQRWLNPSDPYQSKLLTTTESGFMPKNGPALAQEELNLIRYYLNNFSK